MFIEVKASKQSLSLRKLVHGVGTNDSNYMTNHKTKGGDFLICPFYRKWKNMIKRCYRPEDIKSQPTYDGCTVSDNLLLFSNFRVWMNAQDWEGKQLDKDLLIQGNKLYSSETCLFVSPLINSLLIDQRRNRGDYPIGVSFRKDIGKFRATCNVSGKLKQIGHFDTAELAHDAYKSFKYELIRVIASNQIEPLKSALLNYKIKDN